MILILATTLLGPRQGCGEGQGGISKIRSVAMRLVGARSGRAQSSWVIVQLWSWMRCHHRGTRIVPKEVHAPHPLHAPICCSTREEWMISSKRTCPPRSFELAFFRQSQHHCQNVHHAKNSSRLWSWTTTSDRHAHTVDLLYLKWQ